MFGKLKYVIKHRIKVVVLRLFPSLKVLSNEGLGITAYEFDQKLCGENVKIYPPAHITNTTIGNYTYIAQNAYVSFASIGKCCSIGPNLICGWGIHPIESISTHPMFYSTMKQNGMTLSSKDKVIEHSQITIGNDVFIGANVIILDGVTIGDGAVIGAGAVVSKDIPPYAIAVGCPIRILRYRFDEETRKKLLEIKWWDFDEEHLQDVERMFFDVDGFIHKYKTH